MPLTAVDRAALCRADVQTEPDAFVFRSLPAYSAVGGPALGVGLGALWLIVLPPLAPVVAAQGITCGIASAKHPNAEADLARIFDTVDRSALERGVRAALAASTDRCGNIDGDFSAIGAPPTVIRIERVVYNIACSQDNQKYGFTVKWQAMAAPGNRILRNTTTFCIHTSLVDADVWAADADRARAEIERALASTGRRIVLELFATDLLFACQYPPADGDGSPPR